MNQIQLPLGMRDQILDECRKKQVLKDRLEQVFNHFGYCEIITPTIEYNQTYTTAFGNEDDYETYKFFDQYGKTLALRKDMTVPIARVCASKFNNETGPFRFRYCCDVYKVHQSFVGKRSEVTDCGIELIGLDSNSDIEVLNIAFSAMDSLKKNYTIEIGNGNFYRLACNQMGLSEEEIDKMANLIDCKSMVELKEYVSSLQLSSQARSFFNGLPLLMGGESALKEAMELCFSDSLKAVVKEMEDLYKKLCQLGYKDKVSSDFGKIPHLDYYTGIIFQGYLEGSGTSVLSGGRYDTLLEKYGRKLGACGFSIKLDYCLDAIDIEEEKKIKIYYPVDKYVEALTKANELNMSDKVEFIIKDNEEVEVVM